MSNPERPAPGTESTWTVYRQDDHGNRFVVRTHLRQQEAERLVVEFEKRGHKQIYWAEHDQHSQPFRDA